MRRGGEGRIRTSEGNSQQIYSLPRLAASVPLRGSARHRLAERTPFVDAAPPSAAGFESVRDAFTARLRDLRRAAIGRREVWMRSRWIRTRSFTGWSWRGDSNP